MAKNTPIGPGTRVTLRFTLELTNGDIVDSTGDTAATFVVGDGNLLPGFEVAMYGMVAEASARLSIPASQAFGEHLEANMQRLRRGQFPVNMVLTEGLMMSFADNKIQGDSIEVDFNHPLAGKDLIFDVAIVEVEQISNEIIRVSE